MTDYPTSAELRATQLTPELEAEARRLAAKPHIGDRMICALVNALDEARERADKERARADSLAHALACHLPSE